MKLNCYLIKHHLTGVEICDSIYDPPEIAEIEYVQTCPELPEVLDKNVLYITYGSSLNRIDGELEMIPSILCVGKIYKKHPQRINLLQILENKSLLELANMVNMIFHKYIKWEESLQKVIDYHLPARELFIRSGEIIKNPMLAANEEFGFLFFYNPGEQNVYMENFPYINGPEKVTLSNTGIIELLADSTFLELLNDNKPIYYAGSSRRRKKMFYNIFMNKSLVARICIDGFFADINEKDFLLIKTLGKYLAKAIKENMVPLTNQPRDIEELLTSFMNNNYSNRNRIFRILSRYKWSDEDCFLCISLQSDKIANQDNILNIFALNLCHQMNQAYFIKNNTNMITIVINLSKSNLTQTQIANICRRTATSLDVKYGISMICEGIYNLYYYCRQSVFAVKQAFKRKMEDSVLFFKDCQIDFFFKEFLTYNIAEMAIPEALHQLEAYDKQNGSNLLAHLKIYLYNERNIAESAKAAFMHRNTFIYQINKIKQLTNLNLDDYEERLKLMIAFKVKDM